MRNRVYISYSQDDSFGLLTPTNPASGPAAAPPLNPKMQNPPMVLCVGRGEGARRFSALLNLHIPHPLKEISAFRTGINHHRSFRSSRNPFLPEITCPLIISPIRRIQVTSRKMWNAVCHKIHLHISLHDSIFKPAPVPASFIFTPPREVRGNRKGAWDEYFSNTNINARAAKEHISGDAVSRQSQRCLDQACKRQRRPCGKIQFQQHKRYLQHRGR